MGDKVEVTVQVEVAVGAHRAWELWTKPEHITKWNAASPDWHCPRAGGDLRVGGEFSHRMEARDGSFGFDFGGKYTKVEAPTKLAYVLGDGRAVEVSFSESAGRTQVVERFEAETQNSPERQRQGWQSILDNYKRYAES